MSSAFETPITIRNDGDRVVPIDIHNCVEETLANLNIEGLEFFLTLDGDKLKVTLQTNKFLEAQDLAVDLGKKIESIASVDILELAVYKRKSAESQAFLIKEMALTTPQEQVNVADEFVPVATINPHKQAYRQELEQQNIERTKNFVMYGILNSYIIRTISAFVALGLGIFGVQAISRIFDGMEQKPLTYIDVKQLPDLGTIQQEPGMTKYQVVFPRGDTHPSRMWVYLPSTSANAKVPCVFIAAPRHSPLYGAALNYETTTSSEHYPYVSAGYAVIAYDIDGDIDDINEVNQSKLLVRPSKLITKRLKAYKAADAGVLNAKLAIDYAVTRIPQIDPNALYTSGAGAGGTTALMVAATDKRIKGAIAYTPITNLPKKYPDVIEDIVKVVPGYQEFIEQSSPDRNAVKMTKPLFIFHDDGNPKIVFRRYKCFR